MTDDMSKTMQRGKALLLLAQLYSIARNGECEARINQSKAQHGSGLYYAGIYEGYNNMANALADAIDEVDE